MARSNEPGSLYWSLIEPVWISLNESWDAGPEEFVKQVRRLPPRIGHLYAAHWCHSEVCSGGFYQFFSNSTGLLAPEAREAFEAIGLNEWSEILSEAIDFFGNPYPRDRADRYRMLLKWSKSNRKKGDPFSPLDDRFFAWLHAEPDRWELAADRYASGD